MLWKIIVEIESTVESRRQRLAVENYCPNERRRLIPLLFEQFCQRRMTCSQRYRKINDAVRTGRKGLLKAKAALCQAVERRSLNVLAAIAAHVVGTKCVNRHQKNVRR